MQFLRPFWWNLNSSLNSARIGNHNLASTSAKIPFPQNSPRNTWGTVENSVGYRKYFPSAAGLPPSDALCPMGEGQFFSHTAAWTSVSVAMTYLMSQNELAMPMPNAGPICSVIYYGINSMMGTIF
jgi:hypothetical protein